MFSNQNIYDRAFWLPSKGSPVSSRVDQGHNSRLLYCRALITVLAVANLLSLLVCKSVLDNALLLTVETSAWFDFATNAGILGTFILLGPKGRSENASSKHAGRDEPLLWLLVAFSAVVMATVPATAGSTLESAVLAARHAALVVLPIVSYAYVCPRVLEWRNYLTIFIAVLAVLCGHSLLAGWLCLTDTTTVVERVITRPEGRCPAIFGHPGMFVTGLSWNPNTLAIALMMLPGMVPCIEEMVSATWVKLTARICLFLIVCHLFLTFSRGAIVTVIVAFALWGATAKVRNKLVVYSSLSILVLLSIFFGQQLLLLQHDSSMLARISIWSKDLAQIASNPYGQGLPAFGSEHLPHSLVLGTIQYFGFHGLTLLLGVIGCLFLRAANGVRSSAASRLLLIAIALTVVIHGSFEYFIGHPTLFANSLFWIVLGFLAGNSWSLSRARPNQTEGLVGCTPVTSS